MPALASRAGSVATAVRQGTVGSVFPRVPPADRPRLEHAIRSAFTGGLNDLLILTAVVALVGAVFSVVLIRQKDFVASGPGAADREGGRDGESTTVAV